MSPDKEAILAAPGTLIVLRARAAADGPELHVRVAADGRVTAFCGHVDLGTGIRTALAQIVAEELDVALSAVDMVLGDTGLAPDQGPTIASNTIQVTARPLRAAAAQAKNFLLAAAATWLETPAANLAVDDGLVRDIHGNEAVAYGELVAGRTIRLELDEATQVKPVAAHRIVGRPVPRVDIPAKATGQFIYVHDVRVPGMLHGRVVRPPYPGRDTGAFVGGSLLGVDEASVRDAPGFVALVVEGDFVGIVAEREEQAVALADALVVAWRPAVALPALDDVAAALRDNPSHRRVLKDTGDVDGALAAAATRLARRYVWPFQMHASIGPSCAVAAPAAGGMTIWSGTQNPHNLRGDLARLLGLPETAIVVHRLEAAGCYGRNCADDVAGDAALLARAVGRPVRVQLTRAQEHLWEPKGAGQAMEVDGGLDADGNLAVYDFSTRYPSNAAPLLALFLTGRVAPQPVILPMGDRTAIPPYDYPAMRVVAHDMAPIVRASWLRGVSALPNTFAHESFIDELAVEAGEDPVAFRLRHLPDARAAALAEATAARAGWEPRTGPRRRGDGTLLYGQGFAYALYVHSEFPGYGAAWSAWVADVTVDAASGEVAVTRVTVGQDSGLMINSAGITHQIHGNVVQATSRVLKEEVRFDSFGVVPREWGGYPILTFPEVPEIDVLLVPRPDEPPLGSGESASVPSAAAIANAIFDATGVRFREPPFTPERIRAGLAPPSDVPAEKRRGWWPFARKSAFVAALFGLAAAAWPWRAAIDPVPPPDTALYSAATLARGKMLAALGNCATCHTGAGGVVNAGGLALETPFGTIHSTNITPDVETGIGAWSYAAFARAMREGLHRDGTRLYPVFPYTSYTRTSETDLQALYAYLMAQKPVRTAAVANALRFPFNLRALLAGWNALFLRPGAVAADPAQSAQWNRGAYLVESLGHCSACHSPRNGIGAERGGAARFTGGIAEGWEAPALTASSRAPVPWDEDELFAYLRTGTTRFHGVAAGPMGPIVADLMTLPAEDVRAMAHYLATQAGPPAADPAVAAANYIVRTSVEPAGFDAGARLFAGACAACHTPAAVLPAPAPPPLGLDTNLHAETPDNLLRILLDGSAAPVSGAPTGMPSFAGHFDDRQLADLAAYLRAKFAPDQPPWRTLTDAVVLARG